MEGFLQKAKPKLLKMGSTRVTQSPFRNWSFLGPEKTALASTVCVFMLWCAGFYSGEVRIHFVV